MQRPDRDEWHLDGADWLARMGDCTRRKVGALIVGPDKRFWGLGYNGGRPGGPSCLDGACPRGRHGENEDGPQVQRCNWCVDTWRWPSGQRVIDLNGRGPVDYSMCSACTMTAALCLCGNAWPCPEAVAPGSSYDTGPGTCIASHAEANAVADAQQRGGGKLVGADMFVSCEPCEGCIRMVRNQTYISTIRWREGIVALP
jgi:deoxycytidylate deaminase